MEVVVGKLAGFCPGVNRAVNKALEASKKYDSVYCLGELVHNKQVIEELEKNNVITVEDINEIPDNSIVIFRAHGVKESIYDIAKKKNLEIIDLTCGKVRLIHEKVKKEKDKSFIIIVGDKDHPECIATKDFAGPNSISIFDETEIIDVYKRIEESNFKRIYVVSQTTYNLEKFKMLSKEIEENFCEFDVIIDNTICNATEERQKETDIISKQVDTVIVIGGKNSANTNKLVDISKNNCKNVYHIQTKKDLQDISLPKNQKIGIVAGASTPSNIIKEVEKYLMEM